jgi:hypothetical protein
MVLARAALVLSVILAPAVAGTASAQDPLIAGGLTRIPPVHGFGADQAVNGDFESHDGSVPAGWRVDAAWSIDPAVVHGGTASLRVTDPPSVPYAQIAFQQVPVPAGIYRLSGWLRTEGVGGNTGSGVRLALDHGVGGQPRQSVTRVVSGTTDWTYVERPNIIITSDRTVTIRLEAYREPAGTAWFDDVRLEEQLPPPLDAFLLYPNFRGMLFDDQSQTIRLDLSATPPDGDFAGLRLDVTLREESGGAVVAQRSYPAAAHVVAEVDGSGMAHGVAHLLEAALVDADGTVIHPAPAYRLSRVSGAMRASMNVAFDERNRVLVRGTPRFVLGVYDSGFGYSEADAHYEHWLWSPTGERRMEGLRINFYLNYWFGAAPAAPMNVLMSNLERRGVMYLQTGNCFQGLPSTSGNFLIDTSDTYVQTIGAHASSAGYYTVDECESQLVPQVHAQYQRLGGLDPDGLTFAAQLGDPPDLFLWADSADVVSTDPYPLVGAEPAGGYAHHLVADWATVARNAVLDARPFMVVLQFFKFTSLGRWPTRAEMRDHAYMAIVEGARGLWWWSLGANALRDACSGWCDEKTAYMDNLKAVVAELADLEPVLLADDSPDELTGNSNAAAIRTRVKTLDGRRYLLAYNYTATAQEATFTWREPVLGVAVYNEDRSVVPAGASFTDSFAAYEAHVYVLDQPSSLVARLLTPADGQALSGPVAVTAELADGAARTFVFAADGTAFASGPAAGVTWDSRAVGDGAHDLSVRIADAEGRVAASPPVRVTVDNTAPDTSMGSALPGTIGEASVTLSWTGSDALAPVAGLTYAFRLEPLDAAFSAFGAATTATFADLANGTYAFSVKSRDAAGNEDASPATATFTVARPDLAVSGLTVPATAAVGASIPVADTVTNAAGTAAASATAFFLSTDASLSADDVPVGRRPVGSLSGPATDGGTTSVTIPAGTPAGGYHLLARADADGAVAEFDEANNTASRPLAVVVPDLTVTSLSAPTLAGAGTAIKVSDTTKNAGTVAAVPSVTRVVVSTDAVLSDDDREVGGRPVPALLAGERHSATVSVALPADLPPRTYYLIAAADGDRALGEISESNNTRARPLTVGPDLVISRLSAVDRAAAGATISISGGVKNTGGGRAGASVIRYYLSANGSLDGGDHPLGSRGVGELNAGKTSTASTSVVVPAVPPGRYQIIAVADGDGLVAEISESNNTATRKLVIE